MALTRPVADFLRRTCVTFTECVRNAHLLIRSDSGVFPDSAVTAHPQLHHLVVEAPRLRWALNQIVLLL